MLLDAMQTGSQQRRDDQLGCGTPVGHRAVWRADRATAIAHALVFGLLGGITVTVVAVAIFSSATPGYRTA